MDNVLNALTQEQVLGWKAAARLGAHQEAEFGEIGWIMSWGAPVGTGGEKKEAVQQSS